ncbi:hypothetical protein SARC_00259 [Sphaeroforma arctica JP610]|uniref:MI domain-containing protein n=1 Tax=Sphaeroforma arctica JP610 TaxID=667725 RepID=A0A0L0GH25_9EUKA|nr:hypothetical protein SARC_00259 [Sphaeroforma arctica JP610]KNC87628.1 hypothetical protein SARC_00259 [Sphaeroforma arctica JP610]|eukprot:XP_014161530.1 hypothetical protein SARC_00259 [Sphaeroforma arctica JP610]
MPYTLHHYPSRLVQSCMTRSLHTQPFSKGNKKSRKDLRKAAKTEKKENARLHHIRNKTAHGQQVMETAKRVAVEKEREKQATEFEELDKKLKTEKKAAELKRKPRVTWDLPADTESPKKKRKLQLSTTHTEIEDEDKNDEDVQMMKDMAKNLGFTHGGSLPKGFAEDGLDWLMNGGGSDEDEKGADYNNDLDDDISKREDDADSQDKGGDSDAVDANEASQANAQSAKKLQNITVAKNDPNSNFFQMLSDSKLVTLSGEGVDERKSTKRKEDVLNSEDEDDRIIREMEKKLGIKNKEGSKLPTKFKEEGLSYILYGSDEDEYLDDVSEEESAASEAENEEQFGDDDDVEEIVEDPSAQVNDNKSSEENSGSDASEDEKEDVSEADNADETSTAIPEAVAESAPSKYVPPHLRKKQSNEKLIQLQRKVKGQLNRLNDTTFTTTVNEIEKLYSVSARRDMHDTITELMLEALRFESRHSDRLMVTYGSFVAAVHGVVGIEFGACFIAALVEKFETCYVQVKDSDPSEQSTKEPANLMSMLAYLYLFKVVSHRIVFDYLSIFIESFSELDVELVLHFLKIVGRNLREDDPGLLKELILNVHEKARRRNADGDAAERKGTRVQFMVEMINDLKNNRMRGVVNDEVAHLITTLKGNLRDIGKTRDNTSSAGGRNMLTVGRDDLLNAHEKGRWWLVGTAWTGKGEAPARESTLLQSSGTMDGSSVETTKLLELARAQRMNTDVRRSIFCVVMGSVDYLDAFEKLLRLGLKDKQEREIVKVIIECCMQEKVYNPYYAYLSSKFCHFNYNYKFTFQYSFWDRFKDMETLSPRAMLNLARLLVHLFNNHALSLAILKVVSFTNLDIYSVNFFRTVFTKLLLENDEAAIRVLFKRLSGIAGIEHLKEGINVFLSHFVLKATKDPEKRTTLKKRIALVKTTMRETTIG